MSDTVCGFLYGVCACVIAFACMGFGIEAERSGIIKSCTATGSFTISKVGYDCTERKP